MEENIQVSQPESPSVLLSPWDLLKNALKEYKAHFRLLALAALIPTLVATIFIALFGIIFGPAALSVATPGLGSIFFILFFALAILIYGWAAASMIIAVDQRGSIGISGALKKALSYLRSYWWLNVLYLFILVGAFALFFIPGVIVAVWFSLIFFVLVLENKKGPSALAQSREYIRGHWWPILSRMLFLIVVAILFVLLVTLITNPLSDSPGLQNIISNLISILIAPLVVLYWYQIYTQLKENKREVRVQKNPWYIWLFGAFGLALMIFIFFSPSFLIPKALDSIDLENLSEEEFQALFEEALRQELESLQLENGE
ncbi:MAG: hypothetical protein Q8P45_02485 [Candidatus Harrisonbacteria bacterium]|nr:hypothetical protein [Candidatus Harrisonbacteria bacterium]